MDNSDTSQGIYDVIVVGAGHAGCEAALAAARMGRRTLVLTMNIDTTALMPCNPSIGGPAKGHLVREIDALGGEMGRATDDTFIHIRTLNTGKGPAVQALRAQVDKAAYRLRMTRALEGQAGLDLKQATVDELLLEEVRGQEGNGTGDANERRPLPSQRYRVCGVVTNLGRRYLGRSVVLTTGTSLAARIIVGDVSYTGGRSGEPAAVALSMGLRDLGFDLIRLKTGTPPRVDARTIDFAQTELVPGSESPAHFGFWPAPGVDEQPFPSPNPVYPLAAPTGWRPQMPCYLVYTNEWSHAAIRANLHRAPLFNGTIEGTGPRYCPSIEDKVVRFSHKERHQLFLEPEGWETTEVYVQGANTSLPEDVQIEMLRAIPALSKVELMRVGYAIEYDCVPPRQITSWLETRLVAGMFLAGQINGTSGYEEAAGQGLLAGINAALASRGEEPLLMERSLSYLGVMVDDLVTSDLAEPYRLFTSRAEHRLLLRQDNADERLTPIGYKLGLIDGGRYRKTIDKYERIGSETERLTRTVLHPSSDVNARLAEMGAEPMSKTSTAASLLCRPEVSYGVVAQLLGEVPDLGIVQEIETRIRYDAYIRKQAAGIERSRKLEKLAIPETMDFGAVAGLRNEAREKLTRFRPATVGMASRVSGVTPADVAVLVVAVEKLRRSHSSRPLSTTTNIP